MQSETTKAIQEPASVPAGWIVEVAIPVVGWNIERSSLFAVGCHQEERAVQLVRNKVGGLHSAVQAKFKLSTRALAELEVGREEVKMLRQ
jgi:hypothetical protein